MGILLGIQFMNASLSYYETTKAGDAVAALKASLKPIAYVKRDGKVRPTHPPTHPNKLFFFFFFSYPITHPPTHPPLPQTVYLHGRRPTRPR